MGTPNMAFPGSVQTRKGAASHRACSKHPSQRRSRREWEGRGTRSRFAQRSYSCKRRSWTEARSTRRAACERGESRSRKMAEGSGKLFEIFWSATMVVATRGGPFEISAIYMLDVLMDHLLSPSIRRENTSVLTHGRQPCCCARAAQHSCRVSAGPV